ncbi:hypothetical protein RSO01_45090 [Reyranella soli]|uniref:Uncharacterized protein n=1 Tax=Reyranella soli TaxID=1230389 RepID=A0A512NEH3_9HYPH|nr:hypothetical protein RSO01_45090 [Reyranella soli]
MQRNLSGKPKGKMSATAKHGQTHKSNRDSVNVPTELVEFAAPILSDPARRGLQAKGLASQRSHLGVCYMEEHRPISMNGLSSDHGSLRSKMVVATVISA